MAERVVRVDEELHRRSVDSEHSFDARKKPTHRQPWWARQAGGRERRWQTYVFAVVVTTLTLFVRLGLEDRVHGQATLVIFTVPIMLSAYVGGARAGLLATALSNLLAMYFLLPPVHSFRVASEADRWNQALVLLAGVVISGLNEALHQAWRRGDQAVRDHGDAEHALFEAGTLRSAILRSANFSCIAIDATGVIQIFNVGAQRMFGYSADEVKNRITPADISDPRELITRAAALSLEFETTIAPGFEALVFKASRGIVDLYELTHVRKDGSRFPASVSVTALRGVRGDIIGYLLIGTDNTASKRAEADRRASEDRYRTFFEYAPNGILIADAESVLEFPLARPGALARLTPAPVDRVRRALVGVRVLVVDDSEINREVTKQILELEGARVWVAHDGLQAVELLTRPVTVDVVLMDVRMPVLDGYEATRRIRLHPSLRDLPIIALTADALSSERHRASAAGMDGYLVKPFDAQHLISSILSRTSRSGPTGLPQAGVARAWPEIEGIDSQAVRERTSDDLDLFLTLLEHLFEEFSWVEDPVPLRPRLMHKLVGSAGMLGAMPIHDLAAEVEQACADGQIARADVAAAELAAQFRRLRTHASPWCAAERAAQAADRAPPTGPAFEPEALAELVALLRGQNLRALAQAGANELQLRRLLGNAGYRGFRDHVDHLRFGEACDLLEAGSSPS